MDSQHGHEEAYKDLSDVELMLRVRDDDGVAFSVLYLRYHARIGQFFYGLSRNRTAASDMAQETFLRIWKFRERYSATGSVPAYLFGFARNIWREHCRVGHRQFSLELHAASGRDIERFMAERHPEPDAAAGRSETHENIFRALDELPEDQRMVFVLRSVESLSLDEVASIV